MVYNVTTSPCSVTHLANRVLWTFTRVSPLTCKCYSFGELPSLVASAVIIQPVRKISSKCWHFCSVGPSDFIVLTHRSPKLQRYSASPRWYQSRFVRQDQHSCWCFHLCIGWLLSLVLVLVLLTHWYEPRLKMQCEIVLTRAHFTNDSEKEPHTLMSGVWSVCPLSVSNCIGEVGQH